MTCTSRRSRLLRTSTSYADRSGPELISGQWPSTLVDGEQQRVVHQLQAQQEVDILPQSSDDVLGLGLVDIDFGATFN